MDHKSFPWQEIHTIDHLKLLNKQDNITMVRTVSPLFLLLQLHRLKCPAIVHIQLQDIPSSLAKNIGITAGMIHSSWLKIENGKLVSIKDVPSVLSKMGVVNTKSMNLESIVGAAMAQGADFSTVLSQIGEDVFEYCMLLHEFSEDVEVEILDVTAVDMGMAMEIPTTFSSLFTKWLPKSQSEFMLLKNYGSSMRAGINWVNTPFNITELSLPMPIVKTYRALQAKNSLSDVIDSMNQVTEMWYHVDTLVFLGLLGITGVQRKAFVEGQSTEPVQTTISQGKTKSNSIAIQVEDPYAEQKKTLREVLATYVNTPAYKVFELTAPNEVNDSVIDAKFREKSLQYHPDRFNGDVELLEIANDVFAQLNELYNSLQTEDARVELRKRLDVERRGLQYVTEEDAQKADVLYAQAIFFFRKNKFDECKQVIDKAFALDPYNWRIYTIHARVYAELGLVPMEDVAQTLAENKEVRGNDRIELLFQGGVLFYRSNKKQEALDIFKKVLDADENHIESKRYLQKIKNEKTVEQKTEGKLPRPEPTLHTETKKVEEPTENKGFFSRLFGKK